MDFSQLRTLVCVAELGSLSKAADRLCTAQPALSRHVRMLEEELKTRLFDRHGRGMILTEQGRAVWRHAVRVLKEIEDIKLEVADNAGSMGGHVSIGMPPTVSGLLAGRLLATIASAHPNATCRIVSAYSLYLLDWMHRGDIDVAILYDPQGIRSLKCEPLVEETLYVVGPRGSGLTMDVPYELRDIAARSLVLPSPDHSLRQIADRAAHDVGISLTVRAEVDSLATLKQLVLGGSGWTILPLAAVQDDVNAGTLEVAPVASNSLTRLLELALPADRPPSRLGLFAHQIIKKSTASLVRSGRWVGARVPVERKLRNETDCPPTMEMAGKA